MSQTAPPEEIVDMSSRRDVPQAQASQSQTPKEQADLSDTSEPLFNMYARMAEDEDKKMASRWQKDADGILIFTGLFSAAVAALVAVSVQDLKPNPQDTSAFYLANIYQLLADLNVSRESIPATPAQPPPFSPPTSAVLVNSLWFLSLVISLTCALLTTLLQQWARRYVRITQPPRSRLQKRAPIRAFFHNGVEKFHLPWSVEALPALLHLSLFLFFSGLVIYLFNINHTVFTVVVWWVAVAGTLYACITLMPIFWHDSPYYAPLSSSVWFFHSCIQYAISQGLFFLWVHGISFIGYIDLEEYRKRCSEGMSKAFQEFGSTLSPGIITQILTWAIHALDEDKDFEQFFEAIPGFYRSKMLEGCVEKVFSELDSTLNTVFSSFLARTMPPNMVAATVRNRRVIMCAEAADAAHLRCATLGIISTVIVTADATLQSVEFRQSMRSSCDKDPGLCVQGIIASIVATVPERERDDHWITLAKDQLKVSEEEFQDYLVHGDSVLLANLICITRPLFRLCLEDISNMGYFHLQFILPCISKFDTHDTLPGLQHEFCALWNEIALEARNHHNHLISWYILGFLRHLYIALHEGTSAAPTAFDALTDDYDPALVEPSSYPLCYIPAHHPDSATTKITLPPTITSPLVPLPDAVIPSAVPHVPQAIVSSHLTPVDVEKEQDNCAAASLDSTTAFATQGPVATLAISSTTNSEFGPPPILAASTSISRPLSSPLSTVPPQRDVDSGVLVSLSSLPISGRSDTPPADPVSSLAPPAYRIDQGTPGRGTISPGSATAISLAMPQQLIAPERQSQPVVSVTDVTKNDSHCPVGAAPSSHDLGHPYDGK
ncbi:hypothetical protein BGW80DRAFT_1460671 [Lactifluus volemus]|nr:hypothetical protein BGW80DRAFT_1460671 [Lactifluus volemus]